MRANVGYQGLDADWARVSAVAPCPICSGLEGCRRHVEEEFACCVQEPSDWRLSNGGWLHRIVPLPVVVAAGLTLGPEPRLGDASSGVAP
jgi:hypothetical protein